MAFDFGERSLVREKSEIVERDSRESWSKKVERKKYYLRRFIYLTLVIVQITNYKHLETCLHYLIVHTTITVCYEEF